MLHAPGCSGRFTYGESTASVGKSRLDFITSRTDRVWKGPAAPHLSAVSSRQHEDWLCWPQTFPDDKDQQCFSPSRALVQLCASTDTSYSESKRNSRAKRIVRCSRLSKTNQIESGWAVELGDLGGGSRGRDGGRGGVIEGIGGGGWGGGGVGSKSSHCED